jgi:23S rRNA pseudouridine955/2504/2580 synthase
MNDLGKVSVKRVKVDEAHEGQRLDNFLFGQLKGVPKSRIYKLVRGGEVRVNGGRAEASRKLRMGDEVRIPPVRVAESVPKPGWRRASFTRTTLSSCSTSRLAWRCTVAAAFPGG